MAVYEGLGFLWCVLGCWVGPHWLGVVGFWREACLPCPPVGWLGVDEWLCMGHMALGPSCAVGLKGTLVIWCSVAVVYHFHSQPHPAMNSHSLTQVHTHNIDYAKQICLTQQGIQIVTLHALAAGQE